MKSHIIKVLLFVLLCSLSVAAQRVSFTVAPQTTDPQIDRNLQNHYVSINTGVAAKNQLFLFFPGTNATPISYRELNNTAADLGFHAISLNYPDDVTVNSLCGGTNSDLDCYAKVRLEIKDGVDRTDLVTITRPNSIENRLIKLLIYLRTQRPTENWGQFLIDDATINWTKIVVSGHSQGGGHAGIIARFHPVLRTVMFAAIDFNGAANLPANWIGQPNTTPDASTADKFWGFSHLRDEQADFTLLSTRIWTAYGMPAFGAIVNVDSSSPPFNNTHSLTSNVECSNFHECLSSDGALVRDQNGVPIDKPVWQYLLSNTPAPFGLVTLKFIHLGQIVNRPAVGRSTKNYKIVLQGGDFDQSTKNFIRDQAVSTEYISANELRAALPAGVFGSVGSVKIQAAMQSGQKTNSLNY